MAADDTQLAIDPTDDEAWAKFIALEDVQAKDQQEEEPGPEASDDAGSVLPDAQEELDPEPLTAAEPEGDAPPVDSPEPARPPERNAEDTHPAKATVPLHELLDERDKRKALEKRIADLEAATAKLDPEPKDAPDPVLDPAGWKAYQDDLNTQTTRRYEELAKQQEQTQFVTAVHTDVVRAKAEGPEYDAAYEFAITSRRNELRALHPSASDEQIAQAIAQDEMALAQTAFRSGERPSAALIRWAASRGYQSQPASTPAAAAIPKDEARARNRSLSSASGTKEPASAITKMGYEEQGSLSDKEWEEQMRRAGMM